MKSTFTKVGAKLLCAAVLAQTLTSATPAFAQSEAISESAQASSLAAASVLAAPILLFAAGANVVVAGIEIVGQTALVTLRAVGRAGVQVVRVAAQSLRAVGAGVGTAVTIAAHSAGALLSIGGEVILFVPNVAAVALLHSSRS